MIANALLYYLIVINVVTFLVYGIDKWKAKKGSWRISEATLLILAAIGDRRCQRLDAHGSHQRNGSSHLTDIPTSC